MTFSSGVHCSPFLPPLVAFVLAALTAPAGLSGAFLLLPFQMSVLGFVSPAVTPTNLIYNLVALPGGVYRYLREGRMVWPLAGAIVLGTVPGVFAGAWIRVRYLPDPANCRLFVSLVLLFLGGRLLADFVRHSVPPRLEVRGAVVRTRLVSLRRIEYEFLKQVHAFSPATVFGLALAVGMTGGIYGIGGGAMIAPFVVSMLGLPVYTAAGAVMAGTLVTSAAGVGSFELLAATGAAPNLQVRPDWALGLLFGAGGLAGSYCGARAQKYLPERWIRLGLGVVTLALAFGYLVQFWKK